MSLFFPNSHTEIQSNPPHREFLSQQRETSLKIIPKHRMFLITDNSNSITSADFFKTIVH